MKLFNAALCTVSIATSAVSEKLRRSSERNGGMSPCKDPARAVLDLLDCVKNEDVDCVVAAYDPGFERFHNEVSTGPSDVTDPTFWEGAFLFFDFDFEIKFINNPARNQTSVRYIEAVTSTDGTNLGFPQPSMTFPFSQTIVQHEHAIVDVDKDCKLIRWEQYGDNKEQTDVGDVLGAILCAITPGCGGSV